MPREPAKPATAIGSSDGPMQQKSRHRKVQVKILYPPEVPLEHIDEHNEVEWQDTSENDEMELGNLHESREECIVDREEAILHGAEQIKMTRSLDLTFLIDYACVAIKIRRL